MKIFRTALMVVWATALAGCGVDLPNGDPGDDAASDGNYIEYEGQRFLVSKEYSDWDEFKDDPNNYPESETQRMADAVRAVQFLPSAVDRETVARQMLDKQFPGFGCGAPGLLNRDQLDSCAVFFVEIPRTGLCRYVGYVKVDGRFQLVADFEAPDVPMISMVAVENDRLNFYGIDKSLIRSESIKPGKEQETEDGVKPPSGAL